MLEIEIIETNIIEGGIEVFARMWKDGIQIGFGKDGSIDVERFRFFNPPVLVADNDGTVVRTSTSSISGVEETIVDIYREDPEEAILQSLEHVLLVKTEKFDDSNIVIGKVGNTTSTFHPSAGFVSPVDGWIDTNSTISWADARALTVADGVGVNHPTYGIVQSEKESDTSFTINRNPVTFDTSPIGTDSISSATISLSSYAGGNDTESTYPADLQITEVTLESTSNLVVADYNIANWSSVKLITAYDLGTFNATAGYHNMPLNSAGLTAINKTGVSSFGVRGENDVDNNTPTARSYGGGYFADETGTTNDPKLVVEHSTTVTTVTKTISAKARILVAGGFWSDTGEYTSSPIISKTIQTKASIKQTAVTKTIQTKARIELADVTKIIQARGRIEVANEKTVQARGRLKVVDITKTIQTKASVLNTQTKTVSAKADIKVTTSETVSSRGYIISTGNEKIISSKASILQTDVTKTVSAKARIETLGEYSVSSKARLSTVGEKTIQSRARVKIVSEQTAQAKADIEQIDVTKTIQSKARLVAIAEQDISAKASVLSLGITKTVSARAWMASTTMKNVSSKARIKQQEIGVIAGHDNNTLISIGTKTRANKGYNRNAGILMGVKL